MNDDDPRDLPRTSPGGYTPGFSRSQIDGTGEPAKPYGPIAIALTCAVPLVSLLIIVLLLTLG